MNNDNMICFPLWRSITLFTTCCYRFRQEIAKFFVRQQTTSTLTTTWNVQASPQTRTIFLPLFHPSTTNFFICLFGSFFFSDNSNSTAETRIRFTNSLMSEHRIISIMEWIKEMAALSTENWENIIWLTVRMFSCESSFEDFISFDLLLPSPETDPQLRASSVCNYEPVSNGVSSEQSLRSSLYLWVRYSIG